MSQTLVASLLTKLTGEIKSVEVDGILSGTLNLSDFRVLVRYASHMGSIKASGIVDALLDVGIEDYFRLSFGISQMTLEEKRAKFYSTYSQSIDWQQEDKEDLRMIEDAIAFQSIPVLLNW